MFRFKNRKNFTIIQFECSISVDRRFFEGQNMPHRKIFCFLADTLFHARVTTGLFFFGKSDGILIPIRIWQEQKVLEKFSITDRKEIPKYSLDLSEDRNFQDLIHLAAMYHSHDQKIYLNEELAPTIESDQAPRFGGRLYMDLVRENLWSGATSRWFIKTSSWREKNFSAIELPFQPLVRQLRPVHAKESPAGA